MTAQSDQELLELAARAAGLERPEFHGGTHLEDRYGYSIAIWSDYFGGYWNPIQSSAHAFWLAVKLGLEVGMGVGSHGEDETWVMWFDATSDRWRPVTEPRGDDPYAATRRAIVRAAAEIGKRMAQPPEGN